MSTYAERVRSGVWDRQAAFLPQAHLDGVTRAGGVPMLLPPQPVAGAQTALDAVDGLLLTGGLDLDPARYGQERHPTTDAPRTDRDDWELELLTIALERDLPVLAICRGLQLLNVALGGTLVQDLPSLRSTARYRGGPAQFRQNDVTVAEGSRLADIVGPSARVHSYHHQAIDLEAERLQITARTDDGLVQAAELADHSFVLGVQWHPEEDVATGDLRLFSALVDAARGEPGTPASRATETMEART